MRDLEVYLRKDLTWSTHIRKRLSKAVRLTHYFKRNTSPLILAHPKICLHKSLIIPIISYASLGIHLTKASISKLETFQKRVKKWVLNDYAPSYLTEMGTKRLCFKSFHFSIKNKDASFITLVPNIRFTRTLQHSSK